MRAKPRSSLSSTSNQRYFTYLPVMLVAICLFFVGVYVDRLNLHAKKQDLKQSLYNQVGAIRARLEGNINNNIQLVKGLVIAISIEPDMTKERFKALSSPLLSGHSEIRNIAAAPDLVIRYMNPVAGNEAAIGLDYRTNSEQYNAVKLARDTGALVMAGPVNLVQGGQGFIARFPVFEDADNTAKFWGIVSLVIDVDKFFTASGLYNSDLDFDIAIRGKDALGNKGAIIFGDDNIFELDPVFSDITLPHGSWRLAAVPKGGWLNNLDNVNAFRIELFVIGFAILVPLLVLSGFMEKKRESEARLRLLFELSPVGIALKNYDNGMFIEVNEAFLKPTGYTFDELVKLSCWDVTPRKYKTDDVIQFNKLERTGQYGPYEKEFIRKDGSHFPVLINGMVIKDSSGKKMIWTFVEDISKRRQAEMSLQRSQKMDAIGQLTGGIAHDFNNILGIILGNIELLKHDLISKSDKAFNRVDSIHDAGQRAIEITKQLLSVSRKKSTRQEIININKLVEKIENLISCSAMPEIEVSHKLDNDLWLTKVNQGEFEDAFLNLTINARDAIDESGRIIIETRNVSIDEAFCELVANAIPGEYIELTVSDNGKGISAQQQEHIFEPFFTTKDEGKGTGLGLAMVYGFIERSGGFIEIKSKEAIGTTIKCYLPRAKGQEDIPVVNNKKGLAPNQGKETLLVVDDEAAILDLARELLERMDYRIITATSGKQALEILQQEPDIDLLFSDVVMPGGINGFELAQRATCKYPKLRVLLTSGYSGKVLEGSDPSQSELSANILNKPYTYNELASRVRAILDE